MAHASESNCAALQLLPAAQAIPALVVDDCAADVRGDDGIAAVTSPIFAAGSGPIRPPKAEPVTQRERCPKTRAQALMALPRTTPALIETMRKLALDLVAAGHTAAAAMLVASMTTRFPLGPELSQTLFGIGATATSEATLTPILDAVGDSLMQAHAYGQQPLFEWAQRVAHQLRRAGHVGAAACMLTRWQAQFEL